MFFGVGMFVAPALKLIPTIPQWYQLLNAYSLGIGVLFFISGLFLRVHGKHKIS
jgi:hypothetical protein